MIVPFYKKDPRDKYYHGWFLKNFPDGVVPKIKYSNKTEIKEGEHLYAFGCYQAPQEHKRVRRTGGKSG